MDGEAVVENNTRSVLVSPIGRKRRILALAGAPGYEFSFLSRALGKDPGLEFDSIVRKGQNESGQSTYLVQAGGGFGKAPLRGDREKDLQFREIHVFPCAPLPRPGAATIIIPERL